MKFLITEEQYKLLEGLLTEGENKPTNPKLWSQCLALARSRYKVCPSAYCNGAAAKRYKSKGGGWRKKSTNESEETNEASSPAQQAAIAINMKKKGIEPKKESFNEDLKRWFKEKWVDIGHKAYPVYRPTRRISKKTPLTVSEIDPEQAKLQIRRKQRLHEKHLPPFKPKLS